VMNTRLSMYTLQWVQVIPNKFAIQCSCKTFGITYDPLYVHVFSLGFVVKSAKNALHVLLGMDGRPGTPFPGGQRRSRNRVSDSYGNHGMFFFSEH